MDVDALVHDYLSRLEAAASPLPLPRRVELAAEVREHIEAALAEAGRTDEVTVRNILERLGSPEEIVAGEMAQAGPPGGAAGASAAVVAGARSRWGAVEVAALLMLTLAWVALVFPFGLEPWVNLLLWQVFGVVGLVFVWSSSVLSWRRKLIVTVLVVALYLFVYLSLVTAGVSPPLEGPSPIDSSVP